VRKISDRFGRYQPGNFGMKKSKLSEQQIAFISKRAEDGPEFISQDLDLWAYQHNVILDFSRLGKPTDNAFVDSYNGRIRADCLTANWFLSLADTQSKRRARRRDYN
jgi:transposase InsO family protein